MNTDSFESLTSKIFTPNPIQDYQWEILPDDYTKYDHNFKLIVIGDSGVGKSCLANRATQNVFEENYNATVGFEFFTFNIRMNEWLGD